MGSSTWTLLALVLVLLQPSGVLGATCGVVDRPLCEGGQLFQGVCGTFQKKTDCWGFRNISTWSLNETSGADQETVLSGEYCCVFDDKWQKECCKADSDTIALLAVGLFVLIIGVMIAFCCCPCCPWNHLLKAEIEMAGLDEADTLAKQTFYQFLITFIRPCVRCCMRSKQMVLHGMDDYELEEEGVDDDAQTFDKSSSRL